MIEFSRHAFPGYDSDAHLLLEDLSAMAAQVESLIALLGAAVHSNRAEAKKAKEIDKSINQMEYDVIGKLHNILGKYSPSVEELRFLISTVRLGASLERIGDIAKVNVRRLDHFFAETGTIPDALRQPTLDMLDITQGMLRAAMQNLVAFDTDQLVKILEQDSKVDEIYISMLKKIQTEAEGAALSQMMLILIKDIERAADHTFEMGRIAYYAHTGLKPKKKELRKV